MSSERLSDSLALKPHDREANYGLARTLAQLNRPFPAARVYLDRLIDGPLRERYLARLRDDVLLHPWRRDPRFRSWLEQAENPVGKPSA
jgi:hypothetical protein